MAESKGLPMTAKWDPEKLAAAKRRNLRALAGQVVFPSGDRLHQADRARVCCKAP